MSFKHIRNRRQYEALSDTFTPAKIIMADDFVQIFFFRSENSHAAKLEVPDCIIVRTDWRGIFSCPALNKKDTTLCHGYIMLKIRGKQYNSIHSLCVYICTHTSPY